MTVATLTGDNGILGKAGQAKNATNKATALEAVELEAIGALDRGGDIEKELLKTNLENNLKATTEDYGDNLIVDYAGYKFLIEQDGNVIFWDGGATVANTPKLTKGMIPVKYNVTSQNWVICSQNDEEWYSYTQEDKKWAKIGRAHV